jgi:hypothetical protein
MEEELRPAARSMASPMRVLASVVLASYVASCLPNDTRAPPGSVLVTAESDGVAAEGIPASATSDGWSISFDRVLVALGSVNLDGDRCDTYSDANYGRIFDLKAAGKQKVSILYALGHCDVGFRSSSPNGDTLLTQGVTEDDKAMMRTPGSDAFAQQSGMSMYVRGKAVLGDLTKTFEWPFRLRARYERCVADTVRGIDLRTKAGDTLNLTLTPASLFADGLDLDRAHLRFQVFADADTEVGNDDGVVSLDELARVPASLAGFGNVPTDGGSDAPVLDAGYVRSVTHMDAGSEPTLADYLYLLLFPAMVRYQGDGRCSVQLAERGLGS